MSISSLSSSPPFHQYSSGSALPLPTHLSPSDSASLCHFQEVSAHEDHTLPNTSSPMVRSDSQEILPDGSLSSIGTPSVSLPHSSRGGSFSRTSPYLMDDMATPNLSPLLRPASGRLMGGMKKLLRIPSSVQAGVATSTAHAENPSIAIVGSSLDPSHSELEQPDRNVFMNKVLTHLKKRPRNRHFSGLKRHRIRKHSRDRPRNRHNPYSDDGYTSDPGLLRDTVVHEEDVEEEEDTESGDPDVEQRAQRISAIENKLDKYKKLLQEEESILQVFKNEYVLGMEGSMSDKETNRLQQKFFNKQSKAKETIDQLKKKVDKYEEQLQYIKQGGHVGVASHHGYGDKMKSRIKKIGVMRNDLKERLKRKNKNNIPHAQATIDEDEDDMEEVVVEEEEELMDEMLVEPGVSYRSDHMLMKDSQNCEFCMGDYSPYSDLAEQFDQQKCVIIDIQKQQEMLFAKLLAERDKSDRLESELNTLMDLYQHGVTELREQLTQMERLTFSKNQDLEDTIENCQSRLHKLEVEVNKTVDEKKAPVPSSWIRRLFVPLLTFLLDFLSFTIRISEHIGTRTGFALMLVLLAVFVFYWFAYSS